jgi:hypothetical protein
MRRMKTRSTSSLRPVMMVPLVGLSLLFGGCPLYDWDDWEYPAVVPIVIAKDDLKNSIKTSAPRDLVSPGKIYTKGDLLFINEKFQGVHVINNADPRSPQKVSFIEVPGCIDIAMKGNILYVDNAIDLVALDVSNPSNAQVTERIPGIFPELTNNEAFYGFEYDRKTHVIVGWKDTVIKGGYYNE